MVSEPWCDYGDMPVKWCDHCKTGKANPRELAHQTVRKQHDLHRKDMAIQAKHESWCSDCKTSIHVDEWITLTAEGSWVHEECPDAS